MVRKTKGGEDFLLFFLFFLVISLIFLLGLPKSFFFFCELLVIFIVLAALFLALLKGYEVFSFGRLKANPLEMLSSLQN